MSKLSEHQGIPALFRATDSPETFPLAQGMTQIPASCMWLIVAAVLFAVLPKWCGSLLSPPWFNTCWVLISPLYYNFTFTFCVTWRVAKCQLLQNPVGYLPGQPLTFALQVQYVSRPIWQPCIKCIKLSERKDYRWSTTFNVKCLMADKDCLTGNKDCLATSKESKRLIH